MGTGILHILSDDSGYGDPACYGSSVPSISPNIDALAAAGTRFTRFLVGSPVCSTSRMTWLSGLHAQRFGAHYVDDRAAGKRHWLTAYTPTVAKRLQRIGWKTGHFGKCHWGEPPYTLRPKQFNYDRFFGFVQGEPNAQFAGYIKTMDSNLVDEDSDPAVFSGYVNDVIATKAIEWITARVASGDNWYAEVWFHEPHEPGTVGLPENANYPTPTYTQAQSRYYGMLKHLDNKIGALMAVVDSNTYVMYSSDNGPEPNPSASFPSSAGSAGPWSSWKTSLRMGGLCVPAILKGPGVPVAVDARFRWSLDWMATCLAIGGYTTTNIPGWPTGYDLRGTPPDRYLYHEYHGVKRSGVTPTIPANEWSICKADTASKWKLLRSAANGTGDALYDLDADPTESTDVGASNTAVRDELKTALTTWQNTLVTETSAHTTSAFTPSNEAEAIFLGASPENVQWSRVIRCADAGDRTAKLAILNKLMGLPATNACPHVLSGVSVASFGAVTTTYPTETSVPTIVVGPDMYQLAGNTTFRARCTGAELVILDDMLFEAPGMPTP